MQMTKNFTGKSNTSHLIHNEKHCVFKAEHLYTGSSHQAESFLLPRLSIALPKGPRRTFIYLSCKGDLLHVKEKALLSPPEAKLKSRYGEGRAHVSGTSRFVLLLKWTVNQSCQSWSQVGAAKPWLTCSRHRQGHLQRGLRDMVAIAGTYGHSSASCPASSTDTLCSTWSRKCAQI